MRKFLLSLLLFSTAFGLMAQNRTISGVVSDPSGPVPGAIVVIKGTTRGAETDFDGKFEVSVANGETLVISSMGMQTQEVRVTASTTTVNVSLKEDAGEVLDEFVVEAYGVVRKSDRTGSLSSVTEDQLKKAGPTTSIDQALQGRVSGVQVNASSGQPGEANSVRIRGTSSFGNNEPLYVVDGMPIGSGQQGGGSNPLASINPADIVSMEILKDASATAIYGSRAANGVVMITTRKGNDGVSKISYEGGFMVSQVAKKLDMMNLREYAAWVTDPFASPGGEGLKVKPTDKMDLRVDPSFLGKGTDWQDELLRVATGHSHQLSITGGNKETQYAMSLGYQDQEGVMIGTDFQRFSGRVNLENQTKSWLKTGVTLAYTRISQSKQPGFEAVNNDNSITVITDETPLMQALLSLPSTPVRDVNGEYYEQESTGEATAIKYNAIASATHSPIFVTSNNVMGSMFANVEFIKNLNWRTEFGVDYTASEDKQFFPKTSSREENSQEGWDRSNMYWRFASTLNYFKQIKKNAITGMVGFEAWESSWDAVRNKKSKYPTDIAIDPTYQNWVLGSPELIGGYKGSSAMLSYLGRLNYSYDNRYLLTATGRFDGSSNFAPEKRWGFFPSFALAWTVSQESFIRDNEKASNLISQLRLRAGYGETGNAGNTIAYLSTFKNYSTFEGEGSAAILNRWPNTDLVWETNWQANIGLDYGMLNSRIQLTLDAFYKQNDNLLVTSDPGITLAKDEYLYSAPPEINLGSIRNTGFEITLNTVNIDNKEHKFQWTSDLSFSVVRNKVVKLDQDRFGGKFIRSGDRLISRTTEGKAPGMFWGYKVDGVIETEDQRNLVERANKAEVGDFNFVDINGDKIVDENDKTWIGDPNPDFTAGFGNTFTYGNWSLTIFLTGSYGNDVYNLLRTKLEGQESASTNQLSSVKDFARVDTRVAGQDAEGKDIIEKFVVNSGTKIPRPNTSGTINLNEASDHFVEDGSFLRIQNVSLGYRFPEKWTKKISINDLRLSANVQNVYTFSKYSGYNPEVSNADVITQGIDTGSYPVPRTYTMNLSFNF